MAAGAPESGTLAEAVVSENGTAPARANEDKDGAEEAAEEAAPDRMSQMKTMERRNNHAWWE